MIGSHEVLWTPDGRTDRQGAGAYIGNATGTMANMASKGTGPVFVKRGRKVWYFRSDLDQWMAAGRVTSTAQARLLSPQVKTGMSAKEGTGEANTKERAIQHLLRWPTASNEQGEKNQT